MIMISCDVDLRKNPIKRLYKTSKTHNNGSVPYFVQHILLNYCAMDYKMNPHKCKYCYF